jgi:hypothetical protein
MHDCKQDNLQQSKQALLLTHAGYLTETAEQQCSSDRYCT